MKHYVVWKGHTRGIFDNWKETESQISGFPGAVFKSFPSLQAAEFARKHGDNAHKGQSDSLYLKEILGDDFDTSISTDAACPHNPGPVEYRGVITAHTEGIFKVGPLQGGSVNLGEFLGIVHGLSWMLDNKNYHVLFSDSRTAIAWVNNKKIKTSIARTSDNQALRKLVDRALEWLNKHPQWSDTITLKKRNTKELGEIPADFGRK